MSWLLEALTWTGRETGEERREDHVPRCIGYKLGSACRDAFPAVQSALGGKSVNLQCRHGGQRRPRACAPGAESLLPK
ncbi:hypothetical protein J3F84DRAFT_360819, partial [Trichoderma pleuroticola]